MSELLSQVRSSHFGIVDISELNPNVLVEFGVMLSSNKPVLIFREEKSVAKLPFDLSGYQCHEYIAKDGTFLVRDRATLIPIHQFIRDFKATRLMKIKSFRDTKDWNGEVF
jgi:hypothetical protein